MRSVKQFMRAAVLVGGSLLIALGYPLSVLADEVPATTTDPSVTTTSTETPSTAATDQTNGETATPVAPTSEQTTTPEAPKPVYVYDSTTGRWNSDEWTYDAVSGTYKPTVKVAPTAPTATNSSDATASLDSNTTTAIANALTGTALTGDASVLSNTKAGDATSGNASSAATIVNSVNSSMTNSTNQQAAQFVSNVMGDVNGDIMLQPMLLKAMLEAAAQPASTSTNIKATTNNAISNDINLGATSGAATVSNNTSAGSATSGSANTVANVMNLVNSLISANQSFVGTVNIYGNLNGDILIAPDFIPKLLASNEGTPSNAVGTASITSTDNTSVVNNIALAAKTGQALVSNNTSAGDAITGSATTNAVIFNLTNHAIVASNSLLVFVNVLGKWVGVIVDAPSGATAAAIGDNVSKNDISPNLVIDATNNTAITNNLNLSSTSGDASVTGNTNAGGATTGNATASANVGNIVGSTMGLSGWFGVLFINVFGSWIGSFGMNTSAGDPVMNNPGASDPLESAANAGQPLRVIEFIPHGPRQASQPTVIQNGKVMPPTNSQGNITDHDTADKAVALAPHSNNTPTNATWHGPALIDALNLPMLLGSLVLVGGSLFGLRRIA